MASFNRIATISVMIMACLGGALALQCASCDHDEFWDSITDASYACIDDPASVGTVSCNTMCYTWAYYKFDHDMVVERGCASESENGTWAANNCSTYENVYSIYDAYVCTCDTGDSCNADDDDYHTCYECESTFSEDYNCRSALEDNYNPVPCLTGHTGCGLETTSFNSWLLNDLADRYCTDTETTDPDGDCTGSSTVTCTYYCSTDGCNSRSAANGIIFSTAVMALAMMAAGLLR